MYPSSSLWISNLSKSLAPLLITGAIFISQTRSHNSQMFSQSKMISCDTPTVLIWWHHFFSWIIFYVYILMSSLYENNRTSLFTSCVKIVFSYQDNSLCTQKCSGLMSLSIVSVVYWSHCFCALSDQMYNMNTRLCTALLTGYAHQF